MAVQFSEEKLNKVKEIMARYPEGIFRWLAECGNDGLCSVAIAD
jgi:hypothetical protein